MPGKTLLTVLVALAVLLPAQPASAAQPHRYTLHGKHKHCRKGYRRVKRTQKTFCIKRAKRKAAKASGPVKLHAHLDPSYTRNPLDPFEVTYAYSASATQEPAARSASISVEEPAPLPSGVLAFYSDGKLECAVNVGGASTGSECPVEYQALGEHRVTTIYSSGEQSATETEVESIAPLATTAALTTVYQPRTPEEVNGTAWWWIGDLEVSPSVSPSSAQIQMNCGEAPAEFYGAITPNDCYIVSAGTEHVYGWFNCSEELAASVRISTTAPTNIDPSVEWPTGSQITEGHFHITAKASGSGYSESSISVPLQFSPTKQPAC